MRNDGCYTDNDWLSDYFCTLINGHGWGETTTKRYKDDEWSIGYELDKQLKKLLGQKIDDDTYNTTDPKVLFPYYERAIKQLLDNNWGGNWNLPPVQEKAELWIERKRKELGLEQDQPQAVPEAPEQEQEQEQEETTRGKYDPLKKTVRRAAIRELIKRAGINSQDYRRKDIHEVIEALAGGNPNSNGHNNTATKSDSTDAKRKANEILKKIGIEIEI